MLILNYRRMQCDSQLKLGVLLLINYDFCFDVCHSYAHCQVL